MRNEHTSEEIAAFAAKLLAMDREQFYNFFMGGTNATGEKHRKLLMALAASALTQVPNKPKRRLSAVAKAARKANKSRRARAVK